MKKIKLNLLSEDSPLLRPRVDYNILLHLEEIVFEHILKPKKIIINSSFDHEITLSLVKSDQRKGLFLSNNHIQNEKGSKLKYTICFFFMQDPFSFTDSIERNKEIFLLFGEIVDLYLNRIFKKYKKGELVDLLTTLDLSFLYKYDYPASYENQKLLSDSSENTRNNYYTYFDT